MDLVDEKQIERESQFKQTDRYKPVNKEDNGQPGEDGYNAIGKGQFSFVRVPGKGQNR
jgi:hypothetical protein